MTRFFLKKPLKTNDIVGESIEANDYFRHAWIDSETFLPRITLPPVL
jgi:hypothetical protein